MEREDWKFITFYTVGLIKDIRKVFIANFITHKNHFFLFFFPLVVFAFNLGVINLSRR